MQTLSWNCLALIAIALCSLAIAVPVPQDSQDALTPVDTEISDDAQNGVRNKRKIFGPDVGFGVKNAVLGYVFGKIDGILDAKAKFLNQINGTNAAINNSTGIEPTVPVNSLQQFLQAIISPKIAAISSKFGPLSDKSAGGIPNNGGVPTPSPDLVDDLSDDDISDLSDDIDAAVASAGSENIFQ